MSPNCAMFFIVCRSLHVCPFRSEILVKTTLTSPQLIKNITRPISCGQDRLKGAPIHKYLVRGSFAQLQACLTPDPGVAFESQLDHITFVKIDREIISTVILPLPLL